MKSLFVEILVIGFLIERTISLVSKTFESFGQVTGLNVRTPLGDFNGLGSLHHTNYRQAGLNTYCD